MNYFDYYTGAFRKFKDYQGYATRKEFNFFILFFFILYMIVCFIAGAFTPFLIISKVAIDNIFYIVMGIIWICFLIHCFPGLALIKRRLNDIIPAKSNIIFRLFFTFELVRLLIGLILGSNMFQHAIKTTIPDFNALYFILALLIFCMNWICLGFYVFLMVKKGKQ